MSQEEERTIRSLEETISQQSIRINELVEKNKSLEERNFILEQKYTETSNLLDSLLKETSKNKEANAQQYDNVLCSKAIDQDILEFQSPKIAESSSICNCLQQIKISQIITMYPQLSIIMKDFYVRICVCCFVCDVCDWSWPCISALLYHII